ncbi:MAG: hydantoinase subunit beta [SAR202 cluster bacterium Io17-Chloro-G9]|nr:MAG: hydantoinase subunit beta [SAR202 cluster bacterium Io17-Chloro-G9]
MFIGVDVGGTNTDAVLMDGVNLLAKAKLPTTADVTSGIVAALKEVLAQRPSDGTVDAVMVGTTHFTNALLERKQLTPTAVLRLCLPATSLLPPLVDWPDSLRDAIGGFPYMVQGGHEFDGREISSINVSEVAAAAREMQRQGVQAVAISGVFSPVNPAHETEAAAVISREAPGLRIALSHENGRIGLLERENAAALNACLGDVAVHTIQGIKDAIQSLGLQSPLYMSQNDGTLMDAEFASRFPVLTISSGPTNSMRGAAFLSGVRDGIVVDVGGTSTDVGALVKGFPREAAVAVRIAGVRTNFRMPDVLSVSLGGGSVIQENPLRIGPGSVGYRLTEEAVVFGGGTLTGTDIAVAGGMAQVGDPGLVKALSATLVAQALQEMRQRMETAIDQVKVSGADVAIVLVGGGSILAGNSLSGAAQVLRPEHGEVANAIGAAIAQVGGQVERVYSLESTARDEALAGARAEAVKRAVAAGASPETVEVVEIDEVPLTYLPSNATLIRVKAVGDLAQPARP